MASFECIDGGRRVCQNLDAMPASTAQVLADAGHSSFPISVEYELDPIEGATIDFSPAVLARLLGMCPNRVGLCAMALSLDSLDVVGSNNKVNVSLIVTTMKGDKVTEPCAAAVDKDNSFIATHGNVRHGNIRGGLDISIPLQPSVYLKDGTRAEQLKKALSTIRNWSDHMGCSPQEVMKKSVHEVMEAADTHGVKHTRVVLKADGSPLQMLISLNKSSAHPLMAKYSEAKLQKVNGRSVMEHGDAKALAVTLSETLAPCTPISKDGLRLKVLPSPEHRGLLTEKTKGALDLVIKRSNLADVLSGNLPVRGHTTQDVATFVDAKSKVKAPPTDEELASQVFAANIGGHGAIAVEGATVDVTDQMLGEAKGTSSGVVQAV